MPGFAARMDRIVGSATVSISNLVAERRRAGADILSFSLGEPDFTTPAHVRDAAKAALDAGYTHYTPGPGIPELREEVAQQVQRELGVPCEAGNVLVTPAKMAVLQAILAVADHGDEVVVPDPGWVSYQPMVAWAHATAVPVALDAQEFRMTPEAVAQAITPRTRAIVLNSPSNPTGGVNTPADVRGIVELAIDHDLWVISDEIYRKILYAGRHLSPAAVEGGAERTILVDGLSKSFAMTGWRIGWAVAPPAAFKEMNKLQSHSLTHCTSFAQHGALAALRGPQDTVNDMVREFRARRDLVVAGLRRLPGVECPEPPGAFYAFPRFLDGDDAPVDDEALARRLIEEAGVAVTPGSAFGDRGRGHLRISYAASQERIREGLARLGRHFGVTD